MDWIGFSGNSTNNDTVSLLLNEPGITTPHGLLSDKSSWYGKSFVLIYLFSGRYKGKAYFC